VVAKATLAYSVVMEAMENAVQHAYPANGEFEFSHVGRWWMTAAIDVADRTLTLAVFDQGLSIPVSLPTSESFKPIERIYHRLFKAVYNHRDTTHDGAIIKAAMKVGQSRTGQSHRGKGLPTMQRFIDDCVDGSLRIVSRNGEYLYRRRAASKTLRHDTTIGGTLIEWSVKL